MQSISRTDTSFFCQGRSDPDALYQIVALSAETAEPLPVFWALTPSSGRAPAAHVCVHRRDAPDAHRCVVGPRLVAGLQAPAAQESQQVDELVAGHAEIAQDGVPAPGVDGRARGGEPVLGVPPDQAREHAVAEVLLDECVGDRDLEAVVGREADHPSSAVGGGAVARPSE